MNLKQLRSRVIINLTQEFVLRYNLVDDVIDSVINSKYVECGFDTQLVKNTYTIDTIANQMSYDLDPEFMLIERVYYDYDDTSGSVDYGDDLDEISKIALDGNAEYGVPEKYWLEQPHTRSKARIYFHPIPSTSGIKIRVAAVKYPELLVNDTDNIELTSIFDQIIIQGATAELGAIGQGIPNLVYFLNSYENNKEKARIILSRSSKRRTYRSQYRETWE